MEKLQPDKKASHKEIMDDFVQVESQVLNKNVRLHHNEPAFTDYSLE